MAKIYGNQQPSERVLLLDAEASTEYGQAVELYEATGRTVLEWQIGILKHMLAKNDEGLWVYTKFGYSVPRRNGKSEVLGMRELQGLFNGEKMLHTAHRTSTSHNAWITLTRMLNDAGYIDKADIPKAEIDSGKYPKDKLYKAHKANGLESVELLETGGQINFRTRTSKGGLGEGFDLLVIDEAQEYQDDQESSLKYTVTSSANPQTIMCGTPPTAISSGTVFTKFRENVLEGKVKNAGWCAWAVEDMTDVYDQDAWAMCNPSLGYILTERAIEDEIGDDDVDFNIQRLGLWIKSNLKSAISLEEWEALKCQGNPQFVGKLHVGIKFGKDGRNISMGIAVKTADNQIFTELIRTEPMAVGVGWVFDFLERCDYAECVIDGKAGEDLIKDGAKERKLKRIRFLSVTEIIGANAMFEQNIFNGTLTHNGQPQLTEAVSNCKKRAIGSSGGYGFASLYDDIDVSVMDAVILAQWSCSKAKERKPQKVVY